MNRVILMGRLTKEPELKYVTTNNTPVCTFTLAVDKKFQKQGEDRQADFIPIVTWRSQAEFASKYFTKGLRVAVVGSLSTRSYDDTEGVKRYVTEVVADEVEFADGKKEGQANNSIPESEEKFPWD
jgi:single-strand DNA-binding protein